MPGPSQAVIDLNIDPTHAPQGGADTLSVASDARVGLAALSVAIGDGGSESEWDSAQLAQMKTRARERIAQAAPEQLALVDAIRAGVPEDGIVIAGVTIMAAWANICMPMDRPRSFITSSYMGTLGFSFPTSLGAKVGNPDRPVVALCGDGGFMYAASELSTAVQHGINVVAVIFNNGVFGASFADQSSRFQGRVVGTELHNPNFMQLAESFGARGIRVDKTEDLPAAIQDAIAGERPTVVEMVTPRLTPPYQLIPPGATRNFSG
jgi:acetolactate synthase-1/2/3 large subunit